MMHSLPYFIRFGLQTLSLLLLLGISLVAQDQSNVTPATTTSITNLQGAINASAAGNQVWVAYSTSKPGDKANPDHNISFAMKDGVTIYRVKPYETVHS